jgi:Ribonuclease G/E
MVSVEIKSPPRQQKGAVLRFVEPLSPADTPGRLPPFLDPVLEAVQEFGSKFDEIVVDDGDAKRLLAENGIQNVSHDNHGVSLFAGLEIDAELNAAFSRHVPLPGGGALTIDETQALTSIDIDTGGLSASSPVRLGEKIALTAASEAVRQVSLRNIGGHVVIDFPKIKGAAGRKRLQERLHKELSRLDKVSTASFSKSGLFTFIAPHRASSLIERFTEEAPCEPLAGRGFRVEFLAKRAVAELESTLRAASSSRFELAVGEEAGAYLKRHVHWSERLRAKYGSRFEIKLDVNCGERGHDLSEQR